jgi:hypothetical protein
MIVMKNNAEADERSGNTAFAISPKDFQFPNKKSKIQYMASSAQITGRTSPLC